ncbi:hypothetical protein [Laceyella putida]|uniref:Uncharacterized protein n=1 Tax=Laceyella putida TaxID=110101 RepID=A0ABW2RPV4_9BACL
MSRDNRRTFWDYLNWEIRNIKQIGITVNNKKFLKQKHAKLESESLASIDDFLFKQINVLKLVYYECPEPLEQPDLTHDQVDKLRSQIVANKRSKKERRTEIRYYFTGTKEDNILSYDAILHIDIYVPEEIIWVNIFKKSFLGERREKGHRGHLIAQEIIDRMSLSGFKHIGRPDFNWAEMDATRDGMAKVSMTAKIDIMK